MRGHIFFGKYNVDDRVLIGHILINCVTRCYAYTKMHSGIFVLIISIILKGFSWTVNN